MDPVPQRNLQLASAIKAFQKALEQHLLTQPGVDTTGVEQAVRNIMNQTLNALVSESENLDRSVHEVVRAFRSLSSIRLDEVYIDDYKADDVNSVLSNVSACLHEGIDSGDWSLIVEALTETTRAKELLSDSSWSDHTSFVWDIDD